MGWEFNLSDKEWEQLDDFEHLAKKAQDLYSKSDEHLGIFTNAE
jgi:hypothetical protein